MSDHNRSGEVRPSDAGSSLMKKEDLHGIRRDADSCKRELRERQSGDLALCEEGVQAQRSGTRRGNHHAASSKRRVLTRSEVHRLLECARRYHPEIHALLHTAIYAGLRVSELAALRWLDIDEMGRALNVRAKGRERRVVVHPKVIRVLRAYRPTAAGDEDLVFTRARCMGVWLRPLAQTAGVADRLGVDALQRTWAAWAGEV